MIDIASTHDPAGLQTAKCSADTVAQLAKTTYNSLPQVGKPVIRSNGIPEWTILAGIIAQHQDSSLHCLSLATGVKCLPHNKILNASGLALHDSHAEILAIRGFNRFLLDELLRIHNNPEYRSPWLSTFSGKQMERQFRFTGIGIYLFISGAPCGDACLDLLSANPDNAIPWSVRPGDDMTLLHGHEYLWERAKVRLKPGRADSPRTSSKSCSDKLLVKSCTSLLNSLLASTINPASCYLDYLIVPELFYHETGFKRAFQERLVTLVGSSWPENYRIQPLKTLTTRETMPPTLIPPTNLDTTSSSATALTSVVFIQGRSVEVLLGGVKMGNKFPPTLRGASCLCRMRMGHDFLQIIPPQYQPLLFPDESDKCTYSRLKRVVGTQTRVVKKTVTEAFGGWMHNAGDDGFTV